MKIEKFKAPLSNSKPPFAEALRALKPGQAIRLKTAGEYARAVGSITATGKRIGVEFSTVTDGDDVLVFIRTKP